MNTIFSGNLKKFFLLAQFFLLTAFLPFYSSVRAEDQTTTDSILYQGKTAETKKLSLNWTLEEKLVNTAAGVLFASFILFLLWRITMKEPEE